MACSVNSNLKKFLLLKFPLCSFFLCPIHSLFNYLSSLEEKLSITDYITADNPLVTLLVYDTLKTKKASDIEMISFVFYSKKKI